jgi:hypothetical protein
MTLRVETNIEIWKVRGLYGMCFASKEDAEVAARNEFPTELADMRYARIHYVHLCGCAVSLRELALRVRDNALGAHAADVLSNGAGTPGGLSPLGEMLRAAVAKRASGTAEPEYITPDAKQAADEAMKKVMK